jgi:hypothetical protein
MIAAAPTLMISLELVCVSFWATRWSGGGLFDVMVVDVSGVLVVPKPPVAPDVVVWVKICVGDDAANSLIV